MRFSDSTHCDIPKAIKYANSDSSPFISDESLSDENSSQNDPTFPQLLIPLTTSSTNLFSKTHSPTVTNDNSFFKHHHKKRQGHFLSLIIVITFDTFLHEDRYVNTQFFCSFKYLCITILRQHAQPLPSHTSSSELVPQSYFTLGFDAASLLSSDAQTAFLSGNLFSEILLPTPVPAHIRLPEYCTAEHSRPPSPNFADYPIRVDDITIYEPKNDPRFTILTERFITINDLSSNKRKKQSLNASKLLT